MRRTCWLSLLNHMNRVLGNFDGIYSAHPRRTSVNRGPTGRRMIPDVPIEAKNQRFPLVSHAVTKPLGRTGKLIGRQRRTSQIRASPPTADAIPTTRRT